MKIFQLVESENTAVMAFGRMNPPTIGHQKLVDKIKSLPGDSYIFLSQSQKPKTDPLDFKTKLSYAKFFFPDVTIGDPEVKTIIQALQKVNSLGYKNLIYVAGSDRVPAFEELINKYNGVEYNFDNIRVVSAGERDPDADGAEGMSASKMRAAAAEGNFEAFAQGVPNQEVAHEMFAAVRKGMGIKDKEAVPAESLEEQAYDRNKLIAAININGDMKEFDLTGKFQGDTKTQIKQAEAFLNDFLKKKRIPSWSMEIHYQGAVSRTTATGQDAPDTPELDAMADQARQRLMKKEAAYESNIGIMELFKFFNLAGKKDPELVDKVKQLIKQRQDKEVWRIVQDYTGDKLVGKQFEGTIYSAIMKEANYGKYWCSTDKKWKYRKGPKQSRSS